MIEKFLVRGTYLLEHPDSGVAIQSERITTKDEKRPCSRKLWNLIGLARLKPDPLTGTSRT